MDDKEAKELDQLSTDSLPVLPRLDRLDRLVEALEGKQWLSAKESCGVERHEDEDGWKQQISLTSALEQVHHKGTLMDRLNMLENRVLQLSLKYLEDVGRSSINPSHEKMEKQQENAVPLQVQHATSTDDPVERAEKLQAVDGRKEKSKRSKWVGWCIF